jgi:hypothetical protein
MLLVVLIGRRLDVVRYFRKGLRRCGYDVVSRRFDVLATLWKKL